jgi:cysteine-rich repeat protein
VNLASKAAELGLVVGKIYETVVFQAERHTTQSNYKLTLSNFTNSRSACKSVCGDGIVTPDEACDDGKNDGSYGSCTATCDRAAFCGDGIVQAAEGEECDDGVNLSPYGGCAPGCKKGGSCGDGVVDSLFGEACDDGVNDGGYGQCDVGCVLGPRCGDGVVQTDHESCDDGNHQGGDGCDGTCHLNAPK